MPYMLTDLVVDRVDIVDEGANSAAFIELFKRKERSDTMTLSDILKSMTPEHAAVVQAELDKIEDLTKSNATLTTDLAKAKEDMEAANENCTKVQEELDTLKQASTPFDETETLKSMPEAARAYVIKMREQKEAAEAELRKSREAEAEAVAVAKAAELKSLPVEQTKLVGIIKGCSPDLLEILTSINAAIGDTVLGELGKSKAGGKSTGTSTEAWEKIEEMAADVVKNTGITKAKAISQVVDANPDLYKEYLQGGAN